MTISEKLDKVFENKTLHIMRGVSGSGKSTFIKNNIPDPKVIHSTDDVIENDIAPIITSKTGIEGYKALFQHMLYINHYGPLKKAHRLNQENAKKSMDSGVENVVIDNTNLDPWESKPYVEYGLEKGYNIKIHTIPPGNLTAKELADRNVHGVPLEVIEKMLAKLKRNPEITVDQILAAPSK